MDVRAHGWEVDGWTDEWAYGWMAQVAFVRQSAAFKINGVSPSAEEAAVLGQDYIVRNPSSHQHLPYASTLRRQSNLDQSNLDQRTLDQRFPPSSIAWAFSTGTGVTSLRVDRSTSSRWWYGACVSAHMRLRMCVYAHIRALSLTRLPID